MIDEWRPEPLVPDVEVDNDERERVVDGAAGLRVKVRGRMIFFDESLDQNHDFD